MAPDAPPRWLGQLEADAPDVVACWRVSSGSFAGVKPLRRADAEATGA